MSHFGRKNTAPTVLCSVTRFFSIKVNAGTPTVIRDKWGTPKKKKQQVISRQCTDGSRKGEKKGVFIRTTSSPCGANLCRSICCTSANQHDMAPRKPWTDLRRRQDTQCSDYSYQNWVHKYCWLRKYLEGWNEVLNIPASIGFKVSTLSTLQLHFSRVSVWSAYVPLGSAGEFKALKFFTRPTTLSASGKQKHEDTSFRQPAAVL